jgi:hypothetical protein
MITRLIYGDASHLHPLEVHTTIAIPVSQGDQY